MMKKIFLALAFICFCTSLSAQKKFEGIPVSMGMSRTTTKVISKFSLFNFNLPEIRSYLQDIEGTSKTIELVLPGYENFVLELEQNDIISPNYSVTISGGKETINLERPDNILTFKGSVKDVLSSRVALTFSDGLIFGSIKKGDKEYFIEPLKGVDKKVPGNTLVIYETKDVIQTSILSCGVKEVLQRSNNLSNRQMNANSATGACKMIELAIASDSSMFTKFKDAPTLLERNIAIVNVMVGIYHEAQFINPTSYVEFKIVKQYISTSRTSEPLSPAYNGLNEDTLLNYFTAWGQVASHFGVNFDIGQMWTARDIDSAVVGIGSIGSICSNNAFQVLEDYVSSSLKKAVTAAHETGHNLGAVHDMDAGYLMSPVQTNPPYTNFSTASINAISAKLAGVTCLASCNAQAPIAQFNVPGSLCLGNTASFTDASVGQVTSRTWNFPDGNPSSSSAASPTVSYATTGTKSISLTVTNAAGSNTISKSILISNSPTALASSCKANFQSPNSTNQPILQSFNLGTIQNADNLYLQGHYNDYVCTDNTLVKAGETYIATAVIGYQNGATYNTRLDVFLDLNNDADFADAGEHLYASPTCTQGVLSFPLTFPSNPPVYNQLLRLRVIAHTCASSITNGCNIPSYSITKDYSVALLPLSVLPVALLGFDGQYANAAAYLHWQTNTEVDNLSFEIERSTNGIDFVSVGRMPGAGNSNTIQNYNYTDNLQAVINFQQWYYRLKTKGSDGNYTYSKIIVLKKDANKIVMHLYPNPVSKGETIWMDTENRLAEKLQIFNAEGQLVLQSEPKKKGLIAVKTGSSWSHGLYLMRITAEGKTVQATFIVN